MSEEDSTKTPRQISAVTLLGLLCLPMLLVLALLFLSLHADLRKIGELTASINEVYLPKLMNRQGLLLNISSLRRVAEIVHTSESPRVRREAVIDAYAIAEDSLFENEPLFIRNTREILRHLQQLDSLRVAQKKARDEISLVERRLIALLSRLPGTSLAGVEFGAGQMMAELERLCPHSVAAGPCTEVRSNLQQREDASRAEAAGNINIAETWKKLEALLNELREQVYGNEVLLVANSGKHIREDIQTIRHRVFLLSSITCAVMFFFFFAIYRLFVVPLTLASRNLHSVHNNQQPIEVRTHIREFQDLLREIPSIFQYVGHLHAQSVDLLRKNQSILHTSLTDALTGINNRRAFDQDLPLMLRHFSPLGLLMLDIDFFKHYNDTLGHQAGDGCLKTVARILQQSLLRQGDRVYRYGGEEFVVLLPNASANAPLTVARRIQQNFRDLKVPHPDSPLCPFVTVSTGIAVCPVYSEGEEESLVALADRALYAAKNNGRNRIALAEEGNSFQFIS